MVFIPTICQRKTLDGATLHSFVGLLKLFVEFGEIRGSVAAQHLQRSHRITEILEHLFPTVLNNFINFV